MERKLIFEVKFRVEDWRPGEGEKVQTMLSFYSGIDDGYIGSNDDFQKLVIELGINPQRAAASHDTCSIGKSYKDGKWYGWSHRAIYGFQIGDTVKPDSCCAESISPGFVAKTEEDCKKLAIAFAESVS